MILQMELLEAGRIALIFLKLGEVVRDSLLKLRRMLKAERGRTGESITDALEGKTSKLVFDLNYLFIMIMNIMIK